MKMMELKRLARTLALSLLFQSDLSGENPQETVRLFLACFDPEKDSEGSLKLSPEDFREALPLALEFFFGVSENLKTIDDDISGVLLNWRLERLSKVDKALIRLAYYEMRHREDIPPRVSLNEALELAKDFGDNDSRAFVNGILDKLWHGLSGDAKP
ncbi:MAG: transcription antitermination factor NusB [Deltaproteobacteria bacterium]|jgi:N utilization substance protein B|nr:transcription antitermination factor NusB [Deltaproteobacteria bacterium]